MEVIKQAPGVQESLAGGGNPLVELLLAGVVEASDDPRFSPGDRVALTGYRVGEIWWGGYAARAKVKAAADYLAVAPEVVAVARELDLGDYDARLPHTPPDHARLVELSARYGLDSPLARLVEALASR